MAIHLPIRAVVPRAVLALALLAAQGARADDAKWPADDVLRSGMTAIRKLTLDSHTLVTHRRMPPAEAQSFAGKISKEASRIRTSAEIPAAAKERLDALLDEIVRGADAVAGRDGQAAAIDGILQIDEALARYPREFDDPTWQPLR